MSKGKTVAIEIELLDRISGGLDRVNKKMDALKGYTDEAKKGLSGLENVSDKVKRSLMGLGMAFSMKQVVTEVATVRGEFQKLEVAFNTMLGSSDKADALMAQLIHTAAITPFDLEGVAQGAKQLLAYGMEADKVNETLIRLGDIAAGLSMPLNDLVYLYGTTMAQGRLYTQDLNQFTGRGIPMIQELAKVFGVAESKVKDLVEAGKVGFPEVQKVIENLTGEGSKFGGLMEEQSKTISGQISNIEDAISTMFNDLGKQSEGVINTTLSGVSYIVEHYEQFGRVLMGLVATYGTYRTACMTVAAVHSLITAGVGSMTAAEAIHYGWIVMVEKAQKLLNATMLSNPYVLVATAIASVIAVMVSMKTETELMQAADEDYEAQKQKVIEAEEEHKRKMEELCSIAGDEALSTDTRREALNRLEQKYPAIFAKYDTEYAKLKNIKKIKLEIAELEAGRSIRKPKNELNNVNKRIKELEAKQRTERWVEANASGTSMRKTGGLNRNEEAELKNLQKKQQQLIKQVRKDDVDAYYANLTGVSNSELRKQIKERESLLARMKMSGRKYGYTIYDGTATRGSYTKAELEYQLNKLRSERNRRNEPRKSSSDWGAADKRAYKAALKEYNDFISKGSNNLTKEEYDKKAKELKEKMELAKKEYDSRKPGSDKDSEKAQKAASKAEAARAKEEAAEERRKQTKEKVGQELAELQRKNDEEEINTMQEGLEKKLRQIENDYQAQKNEINKQETAWKRDNKKAGIATGANGLTTEQTDAIAEAKALNERSRTKAIEEANKELTRQERSDLYAYLKEYGDTEQQKLAIAREYAEKIAKAENAYQKAALANQRDSEQKKLDASDIFEQIDWENVFSDLTSHTKEYLVSLRNQLQALLKSGKLTDVTDISKVQEKVNDINAELSKQGGIFDFVGTKQQEQTRRINEAKAAQTALNEAKEKEADIAKQYEQALGQANDMAMGLGVSDLGSNTAGIQDNLDKYGIDKSTKDYQEMATLLAQLAVQEGKLAKARRETAKATAEAKSKEDGAKVSTKDAIANWFADAQEFITKKGIDQVPDLFSKLGMDGVAEKATQGLSAFNDAAGAAADFANGNFIGALSKGVSSLQSFTSVLGIGGDNTAKMQDKIDELNEKNTVLAKCLEELNTTMQKTNSLAGVNDAYQQSKELIKAEEKNASSAMIAEAQKHGTWRSSLNSSVDDNKIWKQSMARVSGILGKTVRSSKDFLSLSAEDMKKVRDTDKDMFIAILNEYRKEGGKGGRSDQLPSMIQDYIDKYAEAIDDLNDQLSEKVTQTSLDDLESSFFDTLMDMDKDAEDFTDDFSKNLMKAVLKAKVGDLLDKDLKTFYDKWAELAKDGLTQDEINALNKEYDEIVKKGLELRNEASKVTGYTGDSSTSQSGKSGGFSAMTQDQGTKLEGMFTSGLQHWSSMDDQLENVVEKMNVAESHLARIAENTGMSATHLNDIKEEIRKIIRDGLKMK